MLSLFESKERRAKDTAEVRQIFAKYGEDAVRVMRERLRDPSLSQRDRKHWKRLARKVSAHQRAHLSRASKQKEASA